MIGDAMEYPVQGDDALVRLVNGGVIALLASVLIFPGILIGGYSVAVCRGVLEGRTEPPAWEDWGRLARDGLAVVAITLVYWLPGLLLGAVGVGVLSVTGGDAPGLSFLLAAGGSLVAFAYALFVSYALPAAIVNFARTGELSAAWDVSTLRTVLGHPEYGKAWVVGAVLLFAFNSAGSTLVWFLVGFLVLFVGQVVAMYVFTRGTMAALDLSPEPEPVVDSGGLRADAGDADERSGAAGGAGYPEESITGPGDGSAEGQADDADGAPADDAVGGPDGDAESGDPAAEASGGSAGQGLDAVAAIEAETAATLRAAGFETVQDLRDASRADLAALDGVGPAMANRIKSNLDHL